MKFILYARASTKDKQQPEHQLSELRLWVLSKGHEIAEEITERESGRKDDRPEWQRALEAVLCGRAAGIASVELSRFGRSTRHLLEVAQAIEQAGGHLVCTRQPIDTTTSVGRLVFTLLAAVATFEAELTAERVRAGVAYAMKQRGGAWGRRRESIPLEAVQLARHLRAEGLSWLQVSMRLHKEGYAQPPRTHGRSAHLRRPWPTGTLRDAVAPRKRVELPPAKPAA